jgi:serine/threonine-protein kinase
VKFLQKDWVLGLFLAVLFGLASGAGWLRGIELRAYDMGMSFSANRRANENVVIIDTSSGQSSRGWPTTRARLPAAVARLRAAGARVIALLDGRAAPETAAVDYLREQADRLGGSSATLARRLAGGLDVEAQLAAQARRAGTVIVGVDPASSSVAAADDPLAGIDNGITVTASGPAPSSFARFLPGYLQRTPISDTPPLAPVSEDVLRASAGFGITGLAPTDLRAPRTLPLVYRSDDRLIPSLALAVAALASGQKTPAFEGRAVEIGGRRLATDQGLHAFPYYYAWADSPPFPTHDLVDLVNGRVSSQELRDHVVLLGALSPPDRPLVDAPGGELLAPVAVLANNVSALLNGDLYAVPAWAFWLSRGAFLLVALYLMFLLPRVRPSLQLLFSAVLLLVLVNVEFILLSAKFVKVELMLPLMLLVAGHVVFTVRYLIQERIRRFQGELSEANRMVGQSFQLAGRLDQALDYYSRCLPSKALAQQLYNLGLDYERRRQFSKAVSTFNLIRRYKQGFSDVEDRIRRIKDLEGRLMLGSSRPGILDPVELTGGNLQKPMLGRYQIEKELGRGAMGVVYLGKDPKIGRTVAIKTLDLAQEFAGQELEEVRARFFREAETAGRLNHPNIVTIYDVGEEYDLAYIAMDYLSGVNLQRFCAPGALLPLHVVLDIGVQVAEALDYAHTKQVVHRDVKPANIIFDRRTGRVKVTDFGVACLTDASKTRTGTILGSPSYMSPEQVQGSKVDGRADIFSLGITLFQLIRGELPFTGQPIAALMYKIANEAHPDVTFLRPDLPKCLAEVIDRALAKDAAGRFQTGAEMAGALRACLRNVSDQN